MGVLEGLEQGLDTPLGADGALVSGGEGQRVRIARAMLRANCRLAILDEPFRGLDRETRKALTASARTRWADSTLLFVSHDIEHALDFERVLVVEDGRIVEDGHPRDLAMRETKFRTMLEAERDVLEELWSAARWRRITVESGGLIEEKSA